MGLRSVVITVLAVGVVLAIVLALTRPADPWIVFAVYGTLGLLAILFERGRYRPKLTGTQFTPTPERYADPVTGELIRVYVDPATGERDYRPDRGDA